MPDPHDEFLKHEHALETCFARYLVGPAKLAHTRLAMVNEDDKFDRAAYARGIRLFNENKFFDAHEVLEDVWRAAPADKKKFFQGLIQLAVALHHHSRGNTVGALSLLKRSQRNLSNYPDGFEGIRLRSLLRSITDCTEALQRSSPLPCIPRLDEPEC